MASTDVAVKAVKSVTAALTKKNPAIRKKPSPTPLRPLEPDRFRAPRGKKEVFLYVLSLSTQSIAQSTRFHDALTIAFPRNPN